MKKCFTKLLALFFAVTGTVSSAFSAPTPNEHSNLSYRHALQMPESLIAEINDCAISVNSLTSEQLDIELDGKGIGKRTIHANNTGNTIIYAFRDFSVQSDISNLANDIQHDINSEDCECVLTGYGKGANFAAKVASNIKNGEVNQVKVIVFCPDSEITDNFKGTCCEYLSCRLQFCKRDERPDYEQGSMIKFSMAPSVAERFSGTRCAVGVATLIGTNFLLNVNDKDGKISKKAKIIVNAVGTVGVATLALSKQAKKGYFSNDEILPRFKVAQNRAWGAWDESDWRHLGEKCPICGN